ncbi:MAG: LysM peptidoglycan-binding domain-containing protein [Deltaproteobacteria bacterium]|jgi:membrane-bound lytic murein transglycosylase D|nr:LysM peptidoglycan-binding domain-containing protein [Deltaproteobacteria bacterium]
MLRILTTLIAIALLASEASARTDDFPRPAAIEPQIRFWTRIYSEVDRAGGLIHDSTHMDVVYEVIRLPEGLSRRARERHVERAKKRYATILRNLAKGKRSGLSAEEAHVLALWPEGVSNATLKSAAKRIRFQLGQADRFLEGIERAGQWAPHIRKSLRAHGVPLELDSLPHVESSYNPAAYSQVGAAGLWQFTRSTGRLFMRVDNVIDERMDPFAASDGAARLLRSNYDTLESWPLAITAYNHGVGGMKRAVSKLGTDDISVIIAKYKSRTFGFASRNFYTEFLAALDVDRNAERYFGPVTPLQPVQYETATLDHFVPAEAVEQALGVDRDTLREHNRSLRPAVWNGAKYVPKGFELRVPADLLTQPIDLALASIPAPQRFAKQHRDRLYTVHRGDTLSKIARKYRVKERELVALNNLKSRHRIRAGQVLVLPDEPGARAPVSVARSNPPADGIYHVRRGDTVARIAARFGLSEAKLVAMNGLRNRHQIAVGQRLRVTADASAELPTAKPEVQIAAIAPAVANPVERAASNPPTPETKSVETSAEVETELPIEIASISSAEAIAEAPASKAPAIASVVVPAPDPSDYAISEGDRITVQADETLGHYADWLEVSTSQLRRLNGIPYGTPVGIGRVTKLDFSVVSRETFEQRRLAYHHTLQEEFFDAYEVVGTDTHRLKRGDTLWELAEKRYRVPVWLLRQYNPTLDFSALQAGARLTVPRVAPRED